jgi:hypothetical protein
MNDITACANVQCEHAVSCYRAKLFRERNLNSYSCNAYFSRDPMLARSRGFDCYWPIKETLHVRRREAEAQ